jgi:CBS domain-containing protein
MSVQSILALKGSAVTTGDPSMTMADVTRCLAEQRIGAIVMTDPSGGVVGIISERDVVRAVAGGGTDVLSQPASRFMTASVVTCSPGQSLHELMDMMTRGRFRHVPVVHHGKLVGIVSIGDVIKHRIAEIEREAEEIRNYIATA